VLTADPTIEVDSGTTTDTSPITDNGGTPGELVKTGAGTLVLNPTGGSNTYSGGTTIQAGTLELGSATAAGSGAITFDGMATLAIDGTAMPTNVIDGFTAGIGTPPGGNIITGGGGGNNSGGSLPGTDNTSFVPGDDIYLKSIANVAGSHADMDYTSHILTVTEGSNQYHLQFDPTQSFAGEFFHLASLNGGTDIIEDAIACYCRGTLIDARHGQTKVETLKIGDEVVTLSGALRPIKWIGRRSYSGRFVVGRADIMPVCIKAGALDVDVPRRDLWISPHHAMHLDGVLIEARDLVNGVSIVQARNIDEVEYFHIELDSHDVIVAEGALSETFLDDDSRGMFHNAPDFHALYPDVVTAPPSYCAPRCDAGYEVEIVRRRIAERAGLRAADPSAIGALRGHVDRINPNQIEGWAQNVDHPEAPVYLDIYADGRLIGQTLANGYREDLDQTDIGSGRHSFAFTSPAGLDFAADTVEVRRSLDGAALEQRAA
jgi:autotransporter-associated beta strand protein